jgi:hypothetical protein
MSREAIEALLEAAKAVVAMIEFDPGSKSLEDAREAVWWLDKAIEDLGEEK